MVRNREDAAQSGQVNPAQVATLVFERCTAWNLVGGQFGRTRPEEAVAKVTLGKRRRRWSRARDVGQKVRVTPYT